MGKYLARPPVYEFLTFDEFVEYAMSVFSVSREDMPNAFQYDGATVTFINDNCYRMDIPYKVVDMVIREAKTLYFNKGDMISFGGNYMNDFVIYTEKEFNKKFYKLEE